MTTDTPPVESRTDPADGGRPYTVVVGVSETSKSAAALTWAEAQAHQNHGRVIAVRAWRPPNPPTVSPGTHTGPIGQVDDVEAEERQRLEADVAATLGTDHQVELLLIQGGKLKVLLDAAAEADLLVVDAPRQLIAGPMFGHRLIYTALCPVVVMPPHVSGEPPSSLSRVAETMGRSVVTAAGMAGRPGYRPPLHT